MYVQLMYIPNSIYPCSQMKPISKQNFRHDLNAFKNLDDLQFSAAKLKSKIIALSPKHLRITLSNETVALDDKAFSNTVRNLGVTFDRDLSFDSHIKQPSFIYLA